MLNFFSHIDIGNTQPKTVVVRQTGQPQNTLSDHFPFIDRIAVAIYEPETDSLKTLAYSSNEPSPLPHYQAKLRDARSLSEILQKKDRG